MSVRLCQRDVFSLSTRSKIPYFFIFCLGHIWGFKEIIFSMLVNLSVLCSKKISCLDKIIVFLLLLYDFKLYISLFYILKPRNNGRRSKLCSLRLGFHPTQRNSHYRQNIQRILMIFFTVTAKHHEVVPVKISSKSKYIIKSKHGF